MFWVELKIDLSLQKLLRRIVKTKKPASEKMLPKLFYKTKDLKEAIAPKNSPLGIYDFQKNFFPKKHRLIKIHAENKSAKILAALSLILFFRFQK